MSSFAGRARIAGTRVSDEPARKTIDDLLRQARSRLDRLEPRDALAAQRAGAILVDTRSGDERRHDGVIPGALHIPRTVLEWRVDPDGDPAYRNPHVRGLDDWLVLVCTHGYSSSLAASTLQELGFARATDVVGGFTAWKEQGLPVSRAAEAVTALPGMGTPDG
jgi:rhodanese-related sulfurtransferase